MRTAAALCLVVVAVAQSPGDGISKQTYAVTDPQVFWRLLASRDAVGSGSTMVGVWMCAGNDGGVGRVIGVFQRGRGKGDGGLRVRR